MDTRSAIGIELEDGTIQAVYCHYDGYLRYVGRVLFDSYNTRDKVFQLMGNGDMRGLSSTVDLCSCFKDADDAHAHEDEGRDNEESPVAQNYLNKATFMNSFKMGWVEYFYYIDLDGTWWVSGHKEPWQKLEGALSFNMVDTK